MSPNKSPSASWVSISLPESHESTVDSLSLIVSISLPESHEYASCLYVLHESPAVSLSLNSLH